jgi:WD40 repeat protein
MFLFQIVSFCSESIKFLLLSLRLCLLILCFFLLYRQVRCLDTFYGGSYQLLLSGSDDKTIKVWDMEIAETKQETKLQQNFDALWDRNSSDPCIPLLAAPDSCNRLQVQFLNVHIWNSKEVGSTFQSRCYRDTKLASKCTPVVTHKIL